MLTAWRPNGQWSWTNSVIRYVGATTTRRYWSVDGKFGWFQRKNAYPEFVSGALPFSGISVPTSRYLRSSGSACAPAWVAARSESRTRPTSRTRVGAGLEAPASKQCFLSQAQRAGGDLQQLVVADPLETLLEAHDARRRQADPLVGGGRPHVRQLLFLRHVHVEVVLPDVLADDLALVDWVAGPDEEGAAGLEVVDRIAGRPALPVPHQRPGGPAR